MADSIKPENDRNKKSTKHKASNKNSDKHKPVQPIERKPISNCYVFAKVMESDRDLCKMFAEWIIGEAIGEIGEVVAERVEGTVLTRSVRFDTCLEGTKTLVNIEMQVAKSPTLAIRMAHYLSWLTTHALKKGKDISKMPKRYVIFVCTFDPIGDADPIYEISNFSQGTHLRPWDDGGCAFIVNTKGDLSRTEPRIAEMLKYIDKGQITQTNEVIMKMCEGIDKAYNDEDWRGTMNSIDFDHYDWKEEGRAEGIATGIAQGRAEGQSAERAREAALLEAMSERGRDTSEFVNAVASGNLDALYLEYGIE